MTVYVVLESSYNDHATLGVFSTPEAVWLCIAEARAKDDPNDMVRPWRRCQVWTIDGDLIETLDEDDAP